MLQGVQCPYAHGVYERNLHPSKYRTQLCTEGNHCSRHVCFFAHSPYQLRAPTHLWTTEEAVSTQCSPGNIQGCEAAALPSKSILHMLCKPVRMRTS